MIALLIVPLLFLSGCVGETVYLVHPQSKEQITCRGGGYYHALDVIQNCAVPYEALGFVRIENLTPEQKDQISKPTVRRVEREITVRQEPLKP